MTRRAGWDFPYELSPRGPRPGDPGVLDVVVAMRDAVERAALDRALRPLGPGLVVEPLLARAPLFWTRVRGPRGATPGEVAALLAGMPVRYVVSAHDESMTPAPPLAFSRAQRAGLARDLAAGPLAWPAFPPQALAPSQALPPESAAAGHWFLGDGGGICLTRSVCGTGAGTRLAVIDDEAADVEHLRLDAVRCVGIERAPATTGHAALMIAWATGAAPAGRERFVGVAPDASARLYCIPKPGVDVVSLPLAIARAVFDGADVVVCASYIEGTVSPLLDDALDVAVHLGRRGRGTAVVFPTGREAASPGDSIHASLSLGLGDPASDPRVHCIAPGGHGGEDWFLWRRPGGKLRPFSNRGPAVRWLAPGDDIAYPFSSRDRLFHAESSGASAIAAGVMLLVLGCNRGLRLRDLHAILARTVDAPAAEGATGPLADPADLLPPAYDRDDHNARSGYGRLNATRACACARDPLALELVAMGEDAMATSWCLRPGPESPYSRQAARWAVRALLARPGPRPRGSRPAQARAPGRGQAFAGPGARAGSRRAPGDAPPARAVPDARSACGAGGARNAPRPSVASGAKEMARASSEAAVLALQQALQRLEHSRAPSNRDPVCTDSIPS